jgi:L-threo-3-deoxy-hexylosonate aldolase
MSAANGANGHAGERTPLRPGIYSPTMTFFDSETEDVDVATIKKHAVRLAEAGLVGLVTMGSNGEAVHLSRTEKATVTRATREALDEAGYKDVPVIVGASEHGIRLTIEACREAEAAGGEYVLIVPPSYYRYAIDEEAIYEYYTKVADASPIPVILYNYPGAVAGIDMDSDLIIKLAKHPNIVGTKFTCGNTGKLTRVALATNARTDKSTGSGYMAFGGMADFTAQTAASGGSGIIAGGANVLPKTCVKVWNLWAAGKYDEARVTGSSRKPPFREPNLRFNHTTATVATLAGRSRGCPKRRSMRLQKAFERSWKSKTNYDNPLTRYVGLQFSSR